MIAWYWLVVAFVIGSAVTTIIHYWFEDANNIVTELFAAIAFPFVWVAWFLVIFWSGLFHPISQKRWNNFVKTITKYKKLVYYHITKSVVLIHDPIARRIQEKWFLVRIKKDGDADD